jgi:hypothetical protein
MSSQLPKPLKCVLEMLTAAVARADGSPRFANEIENALGLLTSLVRKPECIEAACIAVMVECQTLDQEIASCAASRVKPEHSVENAREDVLWAIRQLGETLQTAEASDFALLRGMSWSRRIRAAA